MSNRTLNLTDKVYQYILDTSLRESPIQQELRAATAPLTTHDMQISPEQAQFMAFLVKLINAKKALELGVYTGYSSLSVALALPAEGKIIGCDISEEWTSLGQTYWKKAGVDHKISLKIAPALETLDQLLATPNEPNSFDFIFIDADKGSYPSYYEKCLQLCRPGGIILLDNTLQEGTVADPTNHSPSTSTIRKLNALIQQDVRVDMCLLPVSDGITLVLKK